MITVEALFALFVQANGIEAVPDFANQQIVYDTGELGLGTHTQEKLLGTLEFAGFIDGYQRSEPLYALHEPLPREVRMQHAIDTIVCDLKAGEGVHMVAVDALDHNPYATQYLRGKALSRIG